MKPEKKDIPLSPAFVWPLNQSESLLKFEKQFDEEDFGMPSIRRNELRFQLQSSGFFMKAMLRYGAQIDLVIPVDSGLCAKYFYSNLRDKRGGLSTASNIKGVLGFKCLQREIIRKLNKRMQKFFW